MRPLRIELEGFSAFRDHTVVSFEDDDLFAFVGPTGSGKSSVIDAITFALYGSVARYDDKGAVAPVINAQSAEARVRLDFEVAGTAYTAVRVVRRQKDKASTREARLECGGEVIAGRVSELDAEVVNLLGLSFEQFTKTVMLPQGEFAAFLHEKPAERQALLVRLLDLGVYGEMAKSARARAATAGAQLEVVTQQLRQLGEVDASEEAAARARAAALTELRESLRTQLLDIDAIDAELSAFAGERAELVRQRALLARLAVPAVVEDFEAERVGAEAAVAAAVAALDAARSARDAAEQAVREGPDVRALDEQLRAHDRLGQLRRQLEKAEQLLLDARAELAALEAKGAEHEAVVEAARAVHERAMARAGATELRHALHVGEPCPVCEQVVTVVPMVAPKGEVAQAKRQVDAATREYNAVQRARTKLADEVAMTSAGRDALVTEREALLARLADAPPLDELQRALLRAEGLRVALDDAGAAVRQAEIAHNRADKFARTLGDTERSLRRDFNRVRDAFASLEPPVPGEAELLADWTALVAWGGGAAARVAAALDAGAAREAELSARRDRLRRVVIEACTALGVDGTTPQLLEHLVGLAARLEAKADRIHEVVAQVSALHAQAESLRVSQQIADDLARLLGARGFESWLLEEALDDLVTGATERLFQLSSGQYSLEHDDKRGFCVRDHRNADELRSVKTLSGGETFLASLALALALADNVAALSSQGAPKLDSIFLDEGFGTLDADTLDVVAGAIEELGATGRLVGVVTHIRDLADRLPVRFEVAKVGATSVIERIEK